MTLDQGTTSSRALIVDEKGGVISIGQFQLENFFPKPGWVEQDGDLIWAMEQKAMKAALQKAQLSFKDLSAIGITNQRETTLVWERKSWKIICPAIVWQDRRTTEYCRQIESKKELIRQKNGGSFSIPTSQPLSCAGFSIITKVMIYCLALWTVSSCGK